MAPEPTADTKHGAAGEAAAAASTPYAMLCNEADLHASEAPQDMFPYLGQAGMRFEPALHQLACSASCSTLACGRTEMPHGLAEISTMQLNVRRAPQANVEFLEISLSY